MIVVVAKWVHSTQPGRAQPWRSSTSDIDLCVRTDPIFFASTMQQQQSVKHHNSVSSTCYLVQICFAYYFLLSHDRTVENTCSYQSSRLRPCAARCGLVRSVCLQRIRSSCFSRSLVAPCSAIVDRIPESSHCKWSLPLSCMDLWAHKP
jgi:hypothetical protein